MSRILKLAGAAVMVAGLAIAGDAAFVPAKAWVGQVLLDRAWSESRATGTDARPWGWADFTPLARVHVPRLGVEAVVLDQASGNAMAWGPGHVAGTAVPGAPGLAAVAGHRDTHLAFAADLRPGDEVLLETRRGHHRYRVTDAIVVDSRQWRFETRRDGVSTLALATCWPFGAQTPGPLRFVVFAEEVPEPDLAAAAAQMPLL